MPSREAGIAALVCGISLTFFAIIPLYVSSFVQDYTVAFPLILYGFIQVAIIAVIVGITNKKMGIFQPREEGFEEVDTTRLNRVIVSQNGEEECIVSGKPETTFGEAIQSEWPFETIDENENWVVEDSRSNDITRKRLSDYDGIAKVVLKYSPEITKDYHGEKRTYSSIEEGVDFYD